MGRQIETGRFDTRKQLEEKIMFLSNHTSCTLVQIARNTEVSTSLISKIIKKHTEAKWTKKDTFDELGKWHGSMDELGEWLEENTEACDNPKEDE